MSTMAMPHRGYEPEDVLARGPESRPTEGLARGPARGPDRRAEASGPARVRRGQQLLELDALRTLDPEILAEMRRIARVLPFKANSYVLDELIDWDDLDNDPIFRLVFPQPGMLPEPTEQERDWSCGPVPPELWQSLNPDPGDQLRANVPIVDGRPVRGLQHKYHETVLVFPAPGQTCHSFCGYCFRWPQFHGDDDARHTLSDPRVAVRYLASHPEVTDVLFTGGDCMTMSTARLREWVEPILDGCPNVRNVRFGTKALTWWPYRFTTDRDADDLLRLFERIVAGGRSLNLMAHISHLREMRTDVFAAAVARIRGTGATIRSQSPLVAHVNDDPAVWSAMWSQQVRLGIVPYYMFVDRPTGAYRYYGVPLDRCLSIYDEAIRGVGGLARTARGPVMSAAPGKICLDGIVELGGTRWFVTRMLQARDRSRVGTITLYAHDAQALWIDRLIPMAGQASLA